MTTSANDTATTLNPLPGKVGLLLGPALAALMFMLEPPQGLSAPGWYTLALLAWMVVWWVTEAVPIAATALLPIIVLPLSGIAKSAEATATYADPIIFLFIGGFMIAMAVERWNLHERIALNLIAAVGTKPMALVGSFALASGLLSMWISNTATALMLIPTALGVARAMNSDAQQHSGRLATALVLMVAYGASIGGIGTPVGSPTNLVAVGYLEKQGLELSFLQWMTIAVPLMALMLLIAWWVLAWPLRHLQASEQTATLLAQERDRLGAISAPEQRVLVVFTLVALAWMFSPLLKKISLLSGINDTAIALLGTMLLFILPAGDSKRSRLLDWRSAERIPWGVALLFGGGLSVAAAMEAHGVSEWLGSNMSGLNAMSPILVLLLLAAVTVFASEFMSNTATLAAILPVIAALSLATGVPPLALAFNACMAASLAFMMPIGTPPNAIAYGTGMVSMGQMIKLGAWLNLASIVLITATSEWLAPLVMR